MRDLHIGAVGHEFPSCTDRTPFRHGRPAAPVRAQWASPLTAALLAGLVILLSLSCGGRIEDFPNSQDFPQIARIDHS